MFGYLVTYKICICLLNKRNSVTEINYETCYDASPKVKENIILKNFHNIAEGKWQFFVLKRFVIACVEKDICSVVMSFKGVPFRKYYRTWRQLRLFYFMWIITETRTRQQYTN